MDLGFFPKIESLADGRRRWTWRARSQRVVAVQLELLAEGLRDSSMAEYREALRSQGFEREASATLEADVTVRDLGAGAYEVAVTSPVHPADWDMACVFGVMRAFDRRVGPIVEVQGRARSECPTWFFAGDSAGSG